MQWNELLIRYGELSLKGRNRNYFVRKLKQNIKVVLNDLSSTQILAERDRMILRTENEEDLQVAIERLPRVFGIQSFSPVAICEPTIEAIEEMALQVVGSEETAGKTFKVEIKRSDKNFPFRSSEMQQRMGAHVLRNYSELIVQMRKPDLLLHIDIRKTGAFFTMKTYQGAGGMPIGSNGKSLLMLSGGIDSPVAGYQMLRRGVSIEAIHFESPPFTSDQARKKVFDITEQLCSFGADITLHTIPFTELQQLIAAKIPDGSSMTTTRRMMMQIADRVREEIGALGIVTGESLGQVASQTLESLTAINAVTNTPVLRPLIAMDKLEIIDISQQIETYAISIRPHEDCCTIFTPANPKTKPKLEKVEHFESYTNFDSLIEEAVANRTTIKFPRVKENKMEFTEFL